ncbi:MAG: hypothetical protein AAF603_06475 [Pseudomonadota bacterium]
MTVPSTPAHTIQQRLWFFGLPGVFYSLALWTLLDRQDSLSTPLVVALSIGLSVTAAIYILITAEKARLSSLLPALAMGVLLGSMSYFSLYARLMEAPFGRGLNESTIAVSVLTSMIATYIFVPFYRTAIERRERANHYPSLFEFAWSVPVIAVTAFLFMGAVWLVAWLCAGLFELIGISALADLYNQAWFSFPFSAGVAALGVGTLRHREGILISLKTILLSLVSMVAPVFATVIALFLGILAVRGFEAISLNMSPVGSLSAAMIAGIIFFNAVIREKGRAENKILQGTAVVIALSLAVLLIPTAYGLWIRLEAEGFTPRRIEAVLVVILLGAYAVIYGLSAILKAHWGLARQANIMLALVTLLIGIGMHTPLYQPEIWSVGSQEKRILTKGELTRDDIAFLAFKVGPQGRAALERFKTTEPFQEEAKTVEMIEKALAAETSYAFRYPSTSETPKPVRDLLQTPQATIRPSGEVPEGVLTYLEKHYPLIFSQSNETALVALRFERGEKSFWLFTIPQGLKMAEIIFLETDEEGEPTVLWKDKKEFNNQEDLRTFIDKWRTEKFSLEVMSLSLPTIGGEAVLPLDSLRMDAKPVEEGP